MATRAVNVHVHKARNHGHAGGDVVLRARRNVNFVAMPNAGDAATFDDDHAVAEFFLRREDAAGIDGGGRHGESMLLEVER